MQGHQDNAPSRSEQRFQAERGRARAPVQRHAPPSRLVLGRGARTTSDPAALAGAEARPGHAGLCGRDARPCGPSSVVSLAPGASTTKPGSDGPFSPRSRAGGASSNGSLTCTCHLIRTRLMLLRAARRARDDPAEPEALPVPARLIELALATARAQLTPVTPHGSPHA